MSNKKLIALLPFATPHSCYSHPWRVFHPATLPEPHDRSKIGFNENTDYSTFGTVQVASKFTSTIVATIPPKDTIVGMSLEALLSTYVNPENILAEVERVEHKETSIASQIDAAFSVYQHADTILVIWPYQHFDKAEHFTISGDADAMFFYTHPMMNVRRNMVPECVVISAVDDDKYGSELECKDVQAQEALDTLLKGQYTRTLSIVKISRVDFENHKLTPEYPNLAPLLKKTLAGKRGVMINHNAHSFIY